MVSLKQTKQYIHRPYTYSITYMRKQAKYVCVGMRKPYRTYVCTYVPLPLYTFVRYGIFHSLYDKAGTLILPLHIYVLYAGNIHAYT